MLSTLIAATLFFSDMSTEEMRDTGVRKLSVKEKKALQAWINKKIAQAPNYNKKTNPLLEENLNNGLNIRLSDNTLWEINPSDMPITQGWITPVEIVASPSEDSNYPFYLTNSLTGSQVKARKITSIPNSIVPTPNKEPTLPPPSVGTKPLQNKLSRK